MSQRTPVYLGLDTLNDSIVLVHAREASREAPVFLGSIGSRGSDATRCGAGGARRHPARPQGDGERDGATAAPALPGLPPGDDAGGRRASPPPGAACQKKLPYNSATTEPDWVPWRLRGGGKRRDVDAGGATFATAGDTLASRPAERASRRPLV